MSFLRTVNLCGRAALSIMAVSSLGAAAIAQESSSDADFANMLEGMVPQLLGQPVAPVKIVNLPQIGTPGCQENSLIASADLSGIDFDKMTDEEMAELLDCPAIAALPDES